MMASSMGTGKENSIAMDNLSSADLDSSSKTPLFIGIAAVIIALTGVILGWLGFSKANELEAQLSAISGATESVSNLESTVESNAETDPLAVNDSWSVMPHPVPGASVFFL